jgi:hypothetical protein
MRMQDPVLQRKCTKCDEDENKILQTKEAPGQVLKSQNQDVSPIVHEVLRSSGKPLDSATRAFMEPRFGHDFSRVRVHSGGVAEQSARDVDANAYTVGNDIVFSAGRFAPATHEGQRLIAHELTHVVQKADQLATAVTALVSPVHDSVKVSSSLPNRTLARETDPQPQTKSEQKTDLKTTRLARSPGEAIKQWKALSLNEQRLVLIRMTGMYGADFAAAFLPYAQGKKKPNISTSIETGDASTLVARGFRYAGNAGGTPTWVHPSGQEVKLVAKGNDIEDCANSCRDTTGKDECIACCEEKIDPDNPECLSACKNPCEVRGANEESTQL